MCRCESGWSPQFRWAEVDRLSSTKTQEGVASWVKVRALRVRFPAWSASARSRHLSIALLRAVDSGLSGKSSPRTVSGFEPRAIGQPMDSQVAPCPQHLSTGRRIGLSSVTRVVAGSSPASGCKCRGSSGAEHVNSQFVSYPSVLSAGRRSWVIVDPAVAVQFRSAAPAAVV